MSAPGRLDEIEARANAATVGPWEAFRDTPLADAWVNAPHDHAVCDVVSDAFVRESDQGDADAAFIANARTDVPALVAALRAVLALHERVPYFRTDPVTFERAPVAEGICGECSDESDVIWPCSTVRAITAALDATS